MVRSSSEKIIKARTCINSCSQKQLGKNKLVVEFAAIPERSIDVSNIHTTGKQHSCQPILLPSLMMITPSLLIRHGNIYALKYQSVVKKDAQLPCIRQVVEGKFLKSRQKQTQQTVEKAGIEKLFLPLHFSNIFLFLGNREIQVEGF